MSTSHKSAGTASVSATADESSLKPPADGRVAFVRPDVRSAVAALSGAIAVDANACVELLNDEIGNCSAATPALACRLVALTALVQRIGWTADELQRATRDDGSCLDDDAGWFTGGSDREAVRTLRAVAPRGAA